MLTVLGGKAFDLLGSDRSAGQHDSAGAKGDGSDALSGFNVNGIYNVKAFGAKGDGATDDSGAIHARSTRHARLIPAATALATSPTSAGQVITVGALLSVKIRYG